MEARAVATVFIVFSQEDIFGYDLELARRVRAAGIFGPGGRGLKLVAYRAPRADGAREPCEVLQSLPEHAVAETLPFAFSPDEPLPLAVCACGGHRWALPNANVGRWAEIIGAKIEEIVDPPPSPEPGSSDGPSDGDEF